MAIRNPKSPLSDVISYLERVPRGRVPVKLQDIRDSFPELKEGETLESRVQAWAALQGLDLTVQDLGTLYCFTKRKPIDTPS